MSMIYLWTWVLSLVGSVGIWAGLWWLKRREEQTEDPILKVGNQEIASSVSHYWRGRHGRLDRAPFYTCMMWSLFIGGLIMLIGGPFRPSTIDAMDPLVQRALAALLCLGTGICIVGFTMGTRFFRPHADLRDCYRLAIIATPANVSTLAVYALAVGNTCHWNLRLFGIGAGGILAVMLAHLLMAWDLRQENKRLDERVSAALQAALKRVRDDQIDH